MSFEGNTIPLSQVNVGDRVRKDIGDIDDLANSIKKFGLIQPIVLTRDFTLVAGERRLKALQSLGVKDLTHGYTFVYNDELDALKLKAMEVEENVRRKNLTWQEEVLAKKRLLEIMQQLYGSPGQGGHPKKSDTIGATTPGFGVNKLAEMLGESNAQTSRDLELAEVIEQVPQIAKADTKEAARRLFALGLVIAQSQAQAKAQPAAPEWTLYEGDFRSLSASAISDSSVDFVIVDPPYGEDAQGMGPRSPQLLTKPFEDDKDSTAALYEDLAKEAFRVLKPDKFAMFFFGPRLQVALTKHLQDAGFEVDPVPLIWVKNNVTNTSPYTRYGRSYEPILVARKGEPKLIRPSQRDVIQIDSVQLASTSERKFFQAQKPVALIEKLILDTTIAGELVVDFCAGSGTTGIAAVKNKRRAVLFEKDLGTCKIARARLEGGGEI